MYARPDFSALGGEVLLSTLHEVCTKEGASDIHLSPEKKSVRLEWRMHGMLMPLAEISHDHYQELLRRVKFESKLKLNITNVPQDGQYSFAFESRRVNVRVATLPTRFGEAITLRFLDPNRGIIALEKLGYPKDITKTLADLVELPQGLVLITGQTGSGKTTTLYALLSTIVGKNRNILTLEDPIEYELAGVIQSEIDPSHDYTFESGLRSLLRHDPDVILVGEIRDAETAQTAINAALTGHLVLSTLHTNSAIEAIPRLLSMGVSPYTFAPALRAVIAQRLVRTVRSDCRGNASCKPEDPKTYDGQMAVAEIVLATTALQQLILSLEQGAALEAQAKKDGYRTMKERGMDLVKDGITTREEIERVIG